MRVVCRKIVSATTGEEVRTSPWLTVGREYVVLEMVAEPGGVVELRLLGDESEGGPGLWDARLFTVSSPAPSSAWTVAIHGDGAVRIGPAAWRRPGFWEAFFDGDRDAVAEFEEATEAMLAEDAAEAAGSDG